VIRGDNHLVMDNMRDDYPKLVQWVWDHGQPVSPHNRLTHEIRALHVTLLDPTDALPLGTGRKLNLGIAAAEALQLIAGVSDPGLMERVQPNFRNFKDGGILHGAYGPRLRWQLQDVQQHLLQDPASRQVITLIWDPAYDRSLPVAPRDLPCTIGFQFFFRNSALELHTHMRSNDVIWGVSYDFFQFTQLQLTMANLLGVEVGPYEHHVGSMHMYAEHLPILDRMHDTELRTRPQDRPLGFGRSKNTWEEVADRARFVLDVASGRIVDGVNANAFDPVEKWYLDKLRPYWVDQT
jgi:thymidylate synthase